MKLTGYKTKPKVRIKGLTKPVRTKNKFKKKHDMAIDDLVRRRKHVVDKYLK